MGEMGAVTVHGARERVAAMRQKRSCCPQPVGGARGKGMLRNQDADGLHLEFSWGAAPPPLDPVWLLVGLPRPQTARKILGETTSYVEDGRFDPKSKRFTVEVIPKMGGDKIKTRVSMWVEPRGDKKIERIVEVDNEVKVFGVGKILEAFIEKQTRSSYDQAATFTNQWIADKGL